MSRPQYPEVVAIAQACQHVPPGTTPWHMVADGQGGWLPLCDACSNLVSRAHKTARKAELAARPKDCVRCGVRTHTCTYHVWRLCGRCLTATRREHAIACSRAGLLSIFATAPMVDTATWAARQRPIAAQPCTINSKED